MSQARSPGRGCQAKGFQEEVTQHSQARFQAKFLNQGSQGSQEHRVPKNRFPRAGFQVRFQAKFPIKVPKQGPKARFPSKFPKVERLPETDCQARFPRFPGRGSQARFPGTGSQRFFKVPKNRFPKAGVLRNRFPSQVAKVSRKRFQSKVPKQEEVCKQGSQKQVPKVPKSLQEQVSKQGSKEQVPKPGSQEHIPRNRFPKISKNRFPRAGFQARFPCKVSKDRCPRTGSQEQVSRNRFPSEVARQEFVSKAPRNRFASKVSRHRFPSKVLVVPDRWSIKGLSRFISKSFQTSFQQTFVDFFM